MAAGSSRVRNLVFALGTILAGLTVHLGGGFLPPAVRDVLGDALWAMMMVWWIGVLAPQLPRRTSGLTAFAICVAVELSQLWRTPWLDAFRRTLPGHLVLGSGHDPRDFLAYAVGVLAALMMGRWSVRQENVRGRPGMNS
jgi:hypothetical protein